MKEMHIELLLPSRCRPVRAQRPEANEGDAPGHLPVLNSLQYVLNARRRMKEMHIRRSGCRVL